MLGLGILTPIYMLLADLLVLTFLIAIWLCFSFTFYAFIITHLSMLSTIMYYSFFPLVSFSRKPVTTPSLVPSYSITLSISTSNDDFRERFNKALAINLSCIFKK
ncbi:hypothetical protein RND81_03G113700 [Saponaria officinalis]|uniref:Uncharacterized protein n=1 Tax=Saponaria officinalis TaxID=3572 RepID=A0AAW1M5L8_SAPOF